MLRAGYLLLALLICFEAANFTGFSWTRLRRLTDEELIDAAIRYDYPNIYSNLAEFKADYSAFNPEVHYWNDLTGEAGSQFWNKLFGLKLFNIRLPDAVVIVASDGIARFSRRCSENSFCSPAIAPDHPRSGIVGTVQYGPPRYEVAQDLSIQWVDGSEGSVYISGNCFAAFSQSQRPALRIGAKDKGDIIVADQYGYRLVAAYVGEHEYYASMKITEQEFVRSQSCDRVARDAWPNVGGASWKR